VKIFVIAVFLTAYFLIVLLDRKINPLVILFGSVGILLISGGIGVKEALAGVNYNVMGVFLGTMILSGLFIKSKVPEFLAVRLVGRSRNVGMALLGICALASFISTFTENFATVLIVAPIAFEVTRK
jgi:Na+/H+ antiporter NhaD/arsenite permease-like protein